METVALVLGIASLIGTLVGAWSNKSNNDFIDETNQENREFQEQTNLQNHQWSLEAAEWEYQHNKPQTQYADLLSAGLTPAAAAQKISGANVSYSPATAVAPQNMPKSTNIFSDSLQQVVSEIGNYSSMAQAQASAEKTQAETKVINETAIKKANAEIEKILADTLKSYSDINVNESQIDLNEANTNLINERIETEQANQDNLELAKEGVKLSNRSIELSNQEKEIQLEFTRKTLDMSVQKTEAEIKILSEQTAKLLEEIGGMQFENKYKEWRDTYIETYGVAPEQGWEDTLFKAVIDGNAKPMLDALSKSLQLVFDSEIQTFQSRSYRTPYQRWRDRSLRKSQSIRNAKPFNPINGGTGYYSIGDWYGYGSSW